ncbi:MAG: hypothetical protein U1F15_01055 [Burkholderiales bacterium]
MLSGCGGGNGAPFNQFAPVPPPIPPLVLLPVSSIVYPGTPSTVTISGGVAPYRAFSSDSTVLPVSSAVASDTIVLSAQQVSAPTNVTLTVQDAAGTSVSGIASIQPAPLLSSGITVTANPNPACAVAEATLCSGSTGTAQVKVTGNAGVGVAGRQVKFDVVQGSFSIVSTNPAQPLVATLTVATDVNGNATVVLSVPPDTPTQTGIIRATDLTSGNQITGTFVIQQITVGGQTLAVLPLGTTTINGPDSQRCSTGASVTNYIFGGTPPYQVGVNFPGAVSLSGVPVQKSGGAFTTITNGTCFINLTYVITDAKGLTIPTGQYPLVTNQVGTAAPTPPPPTALIVTPGAIAKNNCVPANTFQFIGTGGTAPYSAIVSATSSTTSPVLAPQNGLAAGQAVTVSGLTSPSSTTVTLFDASSPRQSATVTIDCSGSAPPPAPSALVIAPVNYNYSSTSCVNQTANFVVTGGTPPYSVFFASPRPGATIAPTTLNASGQGFAVTGLTNGVQTTNVTVADSGVPQLVQIATITCPSVPNPPPALTVAPAGFSYTAAVCGAQNTSSNFVISGGTPPYTVYFSVPGTVGVIAPTTVVSSGLGFSVTGLAATPKLNQITIQDSSPTPLLQFVTITCT